MKTNKRGISLIVLVLTIVIMIVLAGVIITNLNNAGIISRGKNAVKQTNLKQVQEMATTAWGEAIIENVDATVDELKQSIRTKLLLNGISKEELGDYYLDVTQNSVTVMLWEDAPNVIATVGEVPIPKGFVASPYGADKAHGKAENTIEDGLVIYELDLSKGETEIPSTEDYHTSVTTRNQYVWVPVPKDEFDTKFVRKDWENNNSVVDTEGNYYALGKSNKYWEVTPDLELTTANLTYMTKYTLDEVQKMYASVEKYGGFYVARYEAGLDEKNVRGSSTTGIVKTLENVHSKMNKIPYNYIGFSNSETMNVEVGGAVEVARSLYPENNTSYGVVSTLMYGVQWDRTLSWWLETEAKDIAGTKIDVTNSTTYGNYSNNKIAYETFNEGAKYCTYASSKSATPTYSAVTKVLPTDRLLTTGATEEARVNNIYDMAGNVSEQTMEGASTDRRAVRGDCFIDYFYGGEGPVIERVDGYPSILIYKYYQGFRPTLYIK